MTENALLNVFMILNAVLFCYIVAGFAYFWSRRGQNRNVYAFGNICVAAGVWALGQLTSAVISAYIPHETAYFWANKLTYAGMCAMPPTILFFSWVYCGRYKLYSNRLISAALTVVSVMFFAVILTDPLHHLYYASFSIAGRNYAFLWYAFTVWAYLCFFVSGAYVFSHHKHRRPKSIKWFMLCYSMPLLSNTLNIFIRDSRFDFTVISLCFMLTGAYVLVFRHRTVVISPIASRTILTELPYPVVVVSPERAILFENTAAKKSTDFIEFIMSKSNPEVMKSGGRVYRPKSAPMPDGNSMVTFADITEYSRILAELEEQNEELLCLRDELVRQMKEAEEYAIAAEAYAAQRSRMEINARLGSDVYIIVNQIIENNHAALRHEISEKEAIQKNIELTVAAIETVRVIINEFRGGRQRT